MEEKTKFEAVVTATSGEYIFFRFAREAEDSPILFVPRGRAWLARGTPILVEQLDDGLWFITSGGLL